MYDAIVVGAGFAGVCAARILAKRKFRVLLLEGRDRVGGRASTLPVSSTLGFPVELGCMAIHGYDWGNPARVLSENLSLRTTPAAGGPPEMYTANQGPLDPELAQRLRDAVGMAHSTLRSPNVQGTAKSILDAQASFAKDEEKDLFVALARTGEFGPGIALDQVANQWATYSEGVAYASGRDGFVQGGYGALIQKVLDDAGSAIEVKLNAEVTGLSKDGDTVRVQMNDGSSFTGQAVVCTIPVAVLQSSLRKSPSFFEPSLPQTTLDALSRISIGNLEKVALIYERPWWPTEPSAFHMLHPGYKVPILVIPIGPRTGHAKAGLLALIHFALIGQKLHSPANLHDVIASTLLPGNPSVPQPLEAHSSTWASNPFSLGAVTSPCTETTSSTPLDFTTLSRPPVNWAGRLGFAGEGVEAIHRGSVPGAILSGEREGNRVAAFLEAQVTLKL